MEINEKLDLILEMLGEQGRKLEEQGRKLDEQRKTLNIHGQTLNEHSGLLNALIHGQQEIKADLDGFKLATYKRFDNVSNRLDSFEAKQDELGSKVELLANRTWTNEADIYRLKKIAGIT